MDKLIEELKECWVEDKKEVMLTFGRATLGAACLYITVVLLFGFGS